MEIFHICYNVIIKRLKKKLDKMLDLNNISYFYIFISYTIEFNFNIKINKNLNKNLAEVLK